MPRVGKSVAGNGLGYKLHAFVNAGRRIVVWSLMGLNADEKTVARQALLPHLPPLSADALVLADSNYDSKVMHKQTLGPLGIPVLHPLRGQHRVGGHARRIKLQQMGHWRRTLVRVWQDHADLADYVLKGRNEIERVFGVLTCTAGGLGSLPSWVRRLERVRRWVGVKVILYNVRLEVRERRQTQASA